MVITPLAITLAVVGIVILLAVLVISGASER